MQDAKAAEVKPTLPQATSSSDGGKEPDDRYTVGPDGKLVKVCLPSLPSVLLSASHRHWLQEKYRIAEEKDFLRAFAVFDLDKTGVNSSQCYAIQNMLNQPDKEVWP